MLPGNTINSLLINDEFLSYLENLLYMLDDNNLSKVAVQLKVSHDRNLLVSYLREKAAASTQLPHGEIANRLKDIIDEMVAGGVTPKWTHRLIDLLGNVRHA